MSKDLKKRGWSFVGLTTVFAFMQAMGLINDHSEGCVTRDKASAAGAALNRLCEVIVLLILRSAIDGGATGLGLLAGLSHPSLHRALVAVHDAPVRAWNSGDLAAVAGMRSAPRKKRSMRCPT
ncbi:hypothetical protein JL39_23315 [Rhizobium sp. YS-1r]|jgi:hypothetical protein|nr:hypothetical protein JL39_23315 [Rhizobium sp. YS-1r]